MGYTWKQRRLASIAVIYGRNLISDYVAGARIEYVQKHVTHMVRVRSEAQRSTVAVSCELRDAQLSGMDVAGLARTVESPQLPENARVLPPGTLRLVLSVVLC